MSKQTDKIVEALDKMVEAQVRPLSLADYKEVLGDLIEILQSRLTAAQADKDDA